MVGDADQAGRIRNNRDGFGRLSPIPAGNRLSKAASMKSVWQNIDTFPLQKFRMVGDADGRPVTRLYAMAPAGSPALTSRRSG